MLIRKIEEVDYQDVYQLVKYELGYQNLEFNKFCWRLDQMSRYKLSNLCCNYRLQSSRDNWIDVRLGLEIEGKIMRIIALAVGT